MGPDQGSKLPALTKSFVFVNGTGLEKAINLICTIVTIIYSYIANDGGTIIPNTTQTAAFSNLLNVILRMFLKTNLTVVMRHRREKFFLTPMMIGDYASALGRCGFQETYMSPLDCDYIKHVAEYYKFILL